MDKIINVALVGFGIGGQVFHAPLITSIKGLKLAKIRVVKKEHISNASTLYLQAEIFSSTEDKFNDQKIEMVVISPSNITHYSLAKKALFADKQVVLTKPFTINCQQAELLGNIVEFESHFDRFSFTVKKDGWRTQEHPGSGILYDLGTHLIDQAVV